MADGATVQAGLAALTAAGWDVIEPNEGGKFGAVGLLPVGYGTAGQVLTSNGAAALPTFQTPAAGVGTVTATAGALTANALVLGAGGTDTKVSTGITSNGAGEISLGVAGTTAGAVNFAGATSGLAQLKAPAVAGAAVITLPDVTSTLATLGANTITGVQTLPLGTAGAPAITPTGGANSGLFWVTATNLAVAVSGLERFRFGSGGQFTATGGFSVGTTVAGADAFLIRAAAATWQFGASDAAVPVAQTLRTQGSRPGIDNNGGAGKLTLGPGPGTGTGTLASLDLVSPVAVASGTGVQTQTRGLQILSGVAVRTVYAVSALPTATAALKGGVAWVNDATMGMITGYGTVPIGGGANEAPVSCNGTAWVIG